MKRIATLFGARLALSFVMFSAASPPRPARAADPVRPPAEGLTAAQKARQHYLQGEAYFKSRNFSEAMEEYQKGYFEKPDSVFVFNMAQCQRLLGHRDAAVELYQRYLREAPTGPGRPVAEKQIAALTATPPNESWTTPPGVVPPAPAPPPPPGIAPLPSAAGTPAPTAVAGTVTPAPPSQAPPLAAPPGAPVYVAAHADEEPETPIYKRWWFWTAAAAAVVAGTLIAVSASSPDRPDCGAGRVCR